MYTSESWVIHHFNNAHGNNLPKTPFNKIIKILCQGQCPGGGHCHWLEYAYARTDRVCFLGMYVTERVWFSNLCARKGRVLECQMCARKGRVCKGMDFGSNCVPVRV